jgi:hypothetical protein
VRTVDRLVPKAVLAAVSIAAAGSACLVDAQLQTSLVTIVLDLPGPLSTTKSGGSASFAMSLSGVALGSATVEVDSSNTSLGQPVPQTLFYAQDAWMKPQSVVVIGHDDGLAGNENYLLAFSLKGTSFLVDYTQSSPQPLNMVAIDDVPGILTAVQAGATSATVDVTLRLLPSDVVVIDLVSAAAMLIDPNQLTFTPANAHTAQAVTLSFGAGVLPLLSLTGASHDPNYNHITSQIQITASQ